MRPVCTERSLSRERIESIGVLLRLLMQVPECGEFKENSSAVEKLKQLKHRLRGEAGAKRRDKKNGVEPRVEYRAPLSVEGQVQELLREATDLKKLEEMFIGWAPYL